MKVACYRHDVSWLLLTMRMVLLDAGLGDYTPGNTQTGKGCLMGVDIGTRNHVVIRQRHEDRLQAVYIGEVDDFDELDAFMHWYQVRAAVVDALPEPRLAQKLAARFEGRVFVAYYPTQPRGVKRASPNQWNDDQHVVNIDRSRALDGVLAGQPRLRTARAPIRERCR